MAVFLAILLPVLSLICLAVSQRTNRRRRLIGNLPTSKTQGVFIGLVELKGTAECESPVQSYLAEQWCVHYRFTVSEHWSRTVTETYTDSEGRSQTRTRIESGWSVVQQGGESVPFYLQDDTGVVLVRPEGAEIRPRRLFTHTCSMMDPLYYGKGPAHAVADSTGQRQFTEHGIPLHDPLFVVGQARERQDIVAAELAQDKGAPLYLLTVENEDQVLRRMGFSLHFLTILGLVLAGGAGAAIASLSQKTFRAFSQADAWKAAGVGAGIYAGLWFVVWAVTVYNALVDVRNRMKQGWAALEVQLKRRHDLIPQLVSVVEAARHHEAGVQEQLAALRGQMQATPPGKSGPDYHGVAAQVNILAERYPDLKAGEAFSQLQRQLIETEQRIALARAYFNDAATAYNTRLEMFPDVMFGKLAGFHRQPLLDAEDFERARVDVKFAS